MKVGKGKVCVCRADRQQVGAVASGDKGGESERERERERECVCVCVRVRVIVFESHTVFVVVVDHEDVPARKEAACLVARTRDLVGEGVARLGASVVIGRGKARGALVCVGGV